MDYSKMDAALSAILSEPTVRSGDRLTVSIRTDGPLDPAQQAELRHLGVHGVESERSVFSATLSPQTIISLTEQPWIRRLSLARQLRPLVGEAR